MEKYKRLFKEGDIFYYHGSDKDLDNLKPSALLNLNYKAETGAWLTSDKIQASQYGSIIYTFDVTKLKILNLSKMTKIDLVIDFWTKEKGLDKKEVLKSLKLANEFVDMYDLAYLNRVEMKGYDAVKLKGELGRGFDLWIGTERALKKLKLVNKKSVYDM